MSCPYFRESYFGICVAHTSQDAIHVPSIDEMEKFCFRAWYVTCPKVPPMKAHASNRELYAANIRAVE